MNDAAVSPVMPASRNIWAFLKEELKPRRPLITPFNVITAPVIVLGLVLIVIRFALGLGAVTNLSQEFPWGLWIGFDVVTGVAFAGGAYVITFAVYVMRAERYHVIVRPVVLNGLLSYMFYAGALTLDLGRPWNIINPIIGNDFGYSSVLFLVAWHFLLYMAAEFLEFSPAIAEWLGLRRARRILNTLLLGAVIFGITLSSLHQSGLGALFLLAKAKIHPLWYNEFIPIFFLCSSVFAGLSMVILEGTISHRVFREQIDPKKHASFDEIVFGLAKAAAVAMFVYYFFQALIFIHDKRWRLINDFWGYWYLLEIIGFVLVPCFLYASAVRRRSITLVRVAVGLTLVGIVLNRLNVSIIAFNWRAPVRYYPSWEEIMITLAVIFAEIWAFRWIVNRMPVLRHAEGPEAAPAAAPR